jgi:spore maturation protein CgeB
MKVLMVSMEFDYGDPARGRSYEYYNFYQTLQGMGHQVELFDYMAEIRVNGKAAMNQALLQKVKDFRPDVALFSLYTDQLESETVQQVRGHTRTFCFFHDDTWRKSFSTFWAQFFDCFSSSDFEAVRKYNRLGLRGIFHFPFGVNDSLYKPLAIEKEYDISFVGGWHPHRDWLIRRLRRAGLSVFVAGHKWPHGIVEHDEMVRIFNASKINLNLSNSSSWDVRYLCQFPMAIPRQLKHAKHGEQIKARHFEINACKSFQLSYYVDGLERCYQIGEEMAVFLDPDDLIDKCKYYLQDDVLRENMAQRAYDRTLAEHTYARRFSRLFEHMGIQSCD